MSTDDPRLARLYDYTKFHIGIYLVTAGTMVTIAGSDRLQNFLGDLGHHPVFLILAIVAMGVAGVAGGVIASTCASADDFDDVWLKRIGPWYWQIMPGWVWAGVEHTAFWASLIFLTVAVLLDVSRAALLDLSQALFGF